MSIPYPRSLSMSVFNIYPSRKASYVRVLYLCSLSMARVSITLNTQAMFHFSIPYVLIPMSTVCVLRLFLLCKLAFSLYVQFLSDVCTPCISISVRCLYSLYMYFCPMSASPVYSPCRRLLSIVHVCVSNDYVSCLCPLSFVFRVYFPCLNPMSMCYVYGPCLCSCLSPMTMFHVCVPCLYPK